VTGWGATCGPLLRNLPQWLSDVLLGRTVEMDVWTWCVAHAASHALLWWVGRGFMMYTASQMRGERGRACAVQVHDAATECTRQRCSWWRRGHGGRRGEGGGGRSEWRCNHTARRSYVRHRGASSVCRWPSTSAPSETITNLRLPH
jgi:hypothetical protein